MTKEKHMTTSSTLTRLLRRTAVLIVMLPTIAQGASGPKKLPACNGKHLRDVNIHGSVLPGSPIPGVVAPPAPPPIPQITQPRKRSVAPPPVATPAPHKISARDRPRNYGSC